MTDALQHRYGIIAHEAAHAVAAWMYGHVIIAVDCDRPDVGIGGRVELQWPTTLPMRRMLRERATIARVASLYVGPDWHDANSDGDRQVLGRVAYGLGLSDEALEVFAADDAEELLRDPAFKTAHDAVSRYLLEHVHERVPGDRIVEVIETALA